MNGLRRYEILVPLVHNDGRLVPEPLLAQTFAELREKFGAASWETQTIRGSWEFKASCMKTISRASTSMLPTSRSTGNSFGFSKKRSKHVSTSWRSGSLPIRWM